MMTEIFNKSFSRDFKIPFFLLGIGAVRHVPGSLRALFPVFTRFVRPLWKGIGFALPNLTTRVVWFRMAFIELPWKQPGNYYCVSVGRGKTGYIGMH